MPSDEERFVEVLVAPHELGRYLNGGAVYSKLYRDVEVAAPWGYDGTQTERRSQEYALVFHSRPRDARLVGVYQEQVDDDAAIGETRAEYRVVWERR